jgi:O-antigen/teichoic acid export membrane protein
MERSLINALLGSHDLGLYASGTKVAMLISLVISAFQTAWGPFSLAIHKESDASHTYNWVLKGFSIGMCVAVLLLSAIGEGIIKILASERYAGAGVVVFPLAMGLAIQGTSWITEIGIGLSKKSFFNLHGYIAFLLATGIAIFLLAPTFGFFGVALGVMIGHVAKAVTASWLAQRAYSLPWQFRPAFSAMACTLVIGLIGAWAWYKYDSGVASILFLGGAALILAQGWLNTFTRQERIKIMEYIGKELRNE